MKSFKEWLKEDAPANSTGAGIRGAGYVTDPNGDANPYIDANQQDLIANGDTMNDLLKSHQAHHAEVIRKNFAS